jgi:hypothetical protein
MKKKLYYVVDRQFEDIDGFAEATGYKDVQVYEVLNGEIEKFCYLDLSNEDNTEEAINDYLNDNGFGDDEFELIQL